MKYLVFSVFDSKVGAYMRPLFAPAVGAAVRSFSDEVNRQGSEMNAHPEDYSLYRLGEWTDEDGSFKELPNRPELLVSASTVLAPRDVDPRQMKLVS